MHSLNLPHHVLHRSLIQQIYLAILRWFSAREARADGGPTTALAVAGTTVKGVEDGTAKETGGAGYEGCWHFRMEGLSGEVFWGEGKEKMSWGVVRAMRMS